jgi:hypothetical protein
MGRPTRTFPYVVASALLLTLAACGDSDGPDAEPTPSATPTGASTSPRPTSTGTPEDQASGGTADAPTAVEPRTDLLGWQPVDGSVDDAVTTNGDWSLSVAQDGSTWQLEKVAAGGTSSGQAGANPGWKVSDGLLDEDWAVVVLQDEAEEKPSRATVTNLETGKAFEINGQSDVPTTNGGTWALGDDQLLHATVDRGAYCLASVDLESGRSSVTWCAPKQHGFNAGHVTDDGISLLTFDNAATSCRTVASIAGGKATPFPGVTECNAWEGLLLEDAAVWSVIPDEQRIEEAHLYARVGGQPRVVRRRGVLHARPTAEGRPRDPDAVGPRRRPLRRLRVPQGPGLHRAAALRRRHHDDHRSHLVGRRAGLGGAVDRSA